MRHSRGVYYWYPKSSCCILMVVNSLMVILHHHIKNTTQSSSLSPHGFKILLAIWNTPAQEVVVEAC